MFLHVFPIKLLSLCSFVNFSINILTYSLVFHFISCFCRLLSPLFYLSLSPLLPLSSEPLRPLSCTIPISPYAFKPLVAYAIRNILRAQYQICMHAGTNKCAISIYAVTRKTQHHKPIAPQTLYKTSNSTTIPP